MRGHPRASRLWDLALLALGLAAFVLLAFWLAQGSGRVEPGGYYARGRDFAIFWTTGQLVGEGRAAAAFDPRTFMAAAHRLVSPKLLFHFWSYPPPALFLVAPLAVLRDYLAALAAWTAAGLAALAAALAAVERGRGRGVSWDMALILLCPAVAVNIGFGQNGAFTAALLLGGLALVDRRPLAAGALLGLLVFKPQVALLLPVMVLASGRWRVAAAAAASASALLLASVLVFGWESWAGFFAHGVPQQAAMLQTGHGPFTWMMPSAFMSARLLHIPSAAALLVQAPFTLLAGVFTRLAWRRDGAALPLRMAVLAMATFVASPQGFNYDLIPAAFAALMLWRAGRWWDRLIAVAVWVLPVAIAPLGYLHWPLSPLVLTVALVRLYALTTASRRASPSAAGEVASNT